MSTFLLAVHPATGHLSPLLAMARAMRAGGHRPVFVTSAVNATALRIEAEGFARETAPPVLQLLGFAALPLTWGFAETTLAIELFTSGLDHYAKVLAEVIDRVRPDAVVADFTLPGASLAAELRGVPHAVVYHAGLSFPGPGVPPFGSGLPIGGGWGWRGRWYSFWAQRQHDGLAKRVARVRRRLGLNDEARPSFLDAPASPWLNLVLTAEGAEAARHALPRNTFFVGPCIDGAADSTFDFGRLLTDRPRVYAALGTVFNNRPRVFHRILEAFSDGRRQLIVAAGGAFKRLSRAPLAEHVLMGEHLPQVALLARVDAVIGHGGNNSTNEALAAGKPLLVMPIGGEQGDNASRVEYLGAGLRAAIRTATPGEIRAKVDDLLDRPQYRARAAAVARAFAQTDGVGTSLRLLSRLVETGRPVLRPEGSSLTWSRDAEAPR